MRRIERAGLGLGRCRVMFIYNFDAHINSALLNSEEKLSEKESLVIFARRVISTTVVRPSINPL